MATRAEKDFDSEYVKKLMCKAERRSQNGGHSMTRLTALSNRFGLSVVLYILVSLLSLSPLFAASAPAPAESLDQLYEKAKKEGGKVTVYAPYSNRSIEVILPGFMKRFPGVTVNHVDGTPNQDRKSTRLNSSHIQKSRMPSSA